jgi:hypothetical protein
MIPMNPAGGLRRDETGDPDDSWLQELLAPSIEEDKELALDAEWIALQIRFLGEPFADGLARAVAAEELGRLVARADGELQERVVAALLSCLQDHDEHVQRAAALALLPVAAAADGHSAQVRASVEEFCRSSADPELRELFGAEPTGFGSRITRFVRALPSWLNSLRSPELTPDLPLGLTPDLRPYLLGPPVTAPRPSPVLQSSGFQVQLQAPAPLVQWPREILERTSEGVFTFREDGGQDEIAFGWSLLEGKLFIAPDVPDPSGTTKHYLEVRAPAQLAGTLLAARLSSSRYPAGVGGLLLLHSWHEHAASLDEEAVDSVARLDIAVPTEEGERVEIVPIDEGELTPAHVSMLASAYVRDLARTKAWFPRGSGGRWLREAYEIQGAWLQLRGRLSGELLAAWDAFEAGEPPPPAHPDQLP